MENPARARSPAQSGRIPRFTPAPAILTGGARRYIMHTRRQVNLGRQSQVITALLALALAGCSTYPENASYLYGERLHRSNMRTYATVVTAIDGRETLSRLVPVPVEPGERVIQLIAAPVAGFRFAETRELRLKVEPCKRYFIVAERDHSLQHDWRPVIEHVEDAGGKHCR